MRPILPSRSHKLHIQIFFLLVKSTQDRQFDFSGNISRLCKNPSEIDAHLCHWINTNHIDYILIELTSNHECIQQSPRRLTDAYLCLANSTREPSFYAWHVAEFVCLHLHLLSAVYCVISTRESVQGSQRRRRVPHEI